MNDICYLKPIDNSRIRKPVDLNWSKQFAGGLLLTSILVAVMLVQAWESMQIRQIGYQIETVRSEAEVLQQENHLLLVERAALRSPQRIDVLARGDLGMSPLAQQQMIVLDSIRVSGDQPVMAQVRSADGEGTLKSHVVE